MGTRKLVLLIAASGLIAFGCSSDPESADDARPASSGSVPPSVQPDESEPVDGDGESADTDADVGASIDVSGEVPAASCPDAFVESMSAWNEVGFDGVVVVDEPGGQCVGSFGGETVGGVALSHDSVFSIGSVTKTLTAVAAVSLVESGELALTDSVSGWIDGLSDSTGAITIEQLIAHRSGLANTHADDFDPLTRSEAIALIDEQGVAFEPGTSELYSNSGYTLLAAVIEEAAGAPFRDVVLERVLTVGGRILGGFWNGTDIDENRAQGVLEGDEPGQVGDFDGPHWALEGAGGVAMSPADLAVWASALLDGELIDVESLDALIEGDGRDGGRLVTLGGGDETGHTVALILDVEASTSAVIATTSASPNAEDMVDVVIPSIENDTAISPPAAAVRLDPGQIDDVAGSYPNEVDSSTVDLSINGIGVEATASGGFALQQMFPVPENWGVTVAEHETLTRAFAAGETPAGAEELELLREAAGLSDEVDVTATIVGSAFVTPDLRTYFVYEFDGQSELVWVSLDREGGLNGIDFGQPLPTRQLVAIEPDTFVPADAIAASPPFSITISDDELVVDAVDEP